MAYQIAEADFGQALSNKDAIGVSDAAPRVVISSTNLAENYVWQGFDLAALGTIQSGLNILSASIQDKNTPSALRVLCLPYVHKVYLEFVDYTRRAEQSHSYRPIT